nr:DinI-like family protein [uncultured Haemophilus sp.]
MQATIDIRLFNSAKMKQHKFDRLMEIVQEYVEEEFPKAIVRVRSSTMSDISVFGLGKEGKTKVSEFLENLFNDGSAFDELNDEYY